MTVEVADTRAVVSRLRAAGCVFAEDEAALLIGSASTLDQLESMVARRVAGEPLEVIVGWVDFWGSRWLVEPGVFVPRRRSELLVREALAVAQPGSVVVELCAGVAAIAGAIANAAPGTTVYAAELDLVALPSARRNLAPDRVFAGDLFDSLPVELRGRVDVVVANAPYVPTGEIALMPPEAREHEALIALDGGADGLDVQRRIVTAAPAWLAPDGTLLIETSERQAPHTAALFEAAGLRTRIARDDDLDATIVVGVL
jgi:release factor glutamine methyltransferase